MKQPGLGRIPRPPSPPHRALTVEVVGRVERVQALLAPLREAVLLALVDRLEQLQELLLLLRRLLVGPAAAHRVAVWGEEDGPRGTRTFGE